MNYYIATKGKAVTLNILTESDVQDMLLSIKCNLHCHAYKIPFVKINRVEIHIFHTHTHLNIYTYFHMYVYKYINRMFLEAHTSNLVTVFASAEKPHKCRMVVDLDLGRAEELFPFSF